MAQFGGGYDCEFVEEPPKVLQSRCPVCLQILREPYQADCCGYAFCQACIGRVKANNQPCPCCKAEFDKFQDKRLKRELHEFKVYCTNKNQGCDWVGELEQIDSHLNVNPPKEKQIAGCLFTEIEYLHCSLVAQRYNIHIHQKEECPKRPFKCEYCRNVDSTYEEISTNHWSICDYYPQLCLNNCGETVQRRDLGNHIANDCSMTVVDCDFKHIGCETRLPRKLMKAHLTKVENIALHLSQQVAYQGREMAKLKEENKKLTQQVAKVTQDLQDLQIRTTLYPVEFIVDNFEEYQTNNETWFSPPFYTHQKGYKMNLQVFPNGIGYGWYTHLSIQIRVVQGEYDEQLEWPFQGKFTVQLLDQEEDIDHFTSTISAQSSEANTKIWEDSTYILLADLRPKYLKHDCIKIRVSKIDLWNSHNISCLLIT